MKKKVKKEVKPVVKQGLNPDDFDGMKEYLEARDKLEKKGE